VLYFNSTTSCYIMLLYTMTEWLMVLDRVVFTSAVLYGDWFIFTLEGILLHHCTTLEILKVKELQSHGDRVRFRAGLGSWGRA
jgi:hypothetical protein